jgi:hypothetical protein
MGKARGRKRKSGNRTPSGALSRARIDYGNEVTAAKFDKFGTDGSDAIGRAYRMMLLGSDERAKALLDTARALHRAYWATLPGGADQRDGQGGAGDDERILQRERWLLAQIDTVNSFGHPIRVAFDELVIDVQPDCGPVWLDRIINGGALDMDYGRLSAALDALCALAKVERLTMRRAA